jgi:hypothetical protein
MLREMEWMAVKAKGKCKTHELQCLEGGQTSLESTSSRPRFGSRCASLQAWDSVQTFEQTKHLTQELGSHSMLSRSSHRLFYYLN